VKHGDDYAKDHIMDFCSGDVTPMALLERLGIEVRGAAGMAQAGEAANG
jgi:hypothetical protein